MVRESDLCAGVVLVDNQALIDLAKQKAVEHGLDASLVCAVVEQESGWNPWAIRYEPGFYEHYVAPLPGLSPTEAHARSISWGLMQLMGEVARELGFANTYLSSLLDAATGLDWGCRHLARKMAQASGDVSKALLAWNGSGNPAYPGQVLARQAKYQNPPNNAEDVETAANGD
jgi:soluble lytic murein transglycosylase-like protein